MLPELIQNINYFIVKAVIFSSFVATELIESGLARAEEGGREDCPHGVML